MSNENQSKIEHWVWPDVFRGIAAIMVCAQHARAMLFSDYSAIENEGFLSKIFYMSTGLGHQAVMIFFVLSGFLVGGSVIKNRSQFNWLAYMVARLSRLWVVLIPALILTFLIDSWLNYAMPAITSGGLVEMWGSGPSVEEYSTSLLTFFGNVFFLQTIFVPTYGTNGPLWSLANEFIYYLVFPLLITAIFSKSQFKHRKFLNIAIVITLFSMLEYHFLEGFLIWSFGALVWLLPYPKRINSAYLRYAPFPGALGFFFLSLIYSKSSALESLAFNFPPDIFLGLSFAMLLYALRVQGGLNIDFRSINKLSKYLSDVSYSLYLTHFPFMCLLYQLLGMTKENQLKPDAASIFLLFFFLASSVLFSHAFWWLTERNTSKVRNTVVKLFSIQ